MLEIKINGVSYKNIGNITKNLVYNWYHNVETLDGKIHKELRGKKENYEILFFNDDIPRYNALKTLLTNSNAITLSLPKKDVMRDLGEYVPLVQSDEIKGLLYNGRYYHTALKVTFEKNGFEVD